MKPLLTQMHSAIRARSAYRRTVREISRLPLDVALDLDLYPGDAKSIASQVVYGR